jgi:hypothetical protein
VRRILDSRSGSSPLAAPSFVALASGSTLAVFFEGIAGEKR